MKPFELLEHTADIGMRAAGRTRAELLQHSALGMYAIALSSAPDAPTLEQDLFLQADDFSELFMRFLEELVYLLYVHNLALVELAGGEVGDRVLACKGRFARVATDRLALEIKSPTYHGLAVAGGPSGWNAEVYFDV